MHYGPFYSRPRIEIDLDASDEEWETVYETIRKEAEPPKDGVTSPKDGVEIGKRVPEKVTE